VMLDPDVSLRSVTAAGIKPARRCIDAVRLAANRAQLQQVPDAPF
jgi:hypothetical protein